MGALGMVALAGPALASGYAVREQSAVAQGNSQAGAAARGDDASMMFFNPAAIGWMTGTQVSTGLSAIIPESRTDSGRATRANVFGNSPITGSLGGDAGLDAVVPHFYATTGITDTIRIGIGVGAPFGLVTKYEPDYIGRYHALTSSLRTINITPTISWRPIETLTVGAGLQIQQANARLSSAVDFGAAAAATSPLLAAAGFLPGRFDGRSTIKGDNTNVGFTLGAQWRPMPGTTLGIGFRSSIQHTLQGDATFEGVPLPLQSSANFRNTQGTAKLNTPESLTLGVTQRIAENWTLMAGAEWTNWSRFRDLNISFASGRAPSITHQNYKDSVMLSIGGEYRVRPDITLRAGFAWDQSPVRDEFRTPRIPDSDRYWLSAGATWQVMPNVALTVAYTHVLASNASINLRDGGPGTVDFLRGNLNTRNSANVNILTAGARMTF